MNKQDATRDDINVLIVDDVIANLAVLSEMIKKAGYIARPVTSVKQALQAINIYEPQLILLDISMPDMDGFELCEILKSSVKTRDIPVIIISAMNSSEDKIKAFQLGAVDFIEKPFEIEEVILRINTHIKIFLIQNGLESYIKKLQRLLSEQHQNMLNDYRTMLLTMAKLAEARDNTLEEHFINVAKNCRLLAVSLQLSPAYEDVISNDFITMIELVAPLHDIGKAAVPDYILCKPDKLTSEEMEIAKKHAEIGALALLEGKLLDEQTGLFELAIEVAYYHHEKWDGTGYPKGLKGEEIPISARIMAVIDVYDTLTSDRCYRNAYSHDEAMEIINKEAGKSFDPEIIKIFNKIQKQLVGKNRI